MREDSLMVSIATLHVYFIFAKSSHVKTSPGGLLLASPPALHSVEHLLSSVTYGEDIKSLTVFPIKDA